MLIKQQYEPSAIISRQSNHIGHGHPQLGAFQQSQREMCVECMLLHCITTVKLCRGLRLVNKDYVGGDYTELRLLRMTAECVTDMMLNQATQRFPAPLNSSLSDSEKYFYSNFKRGYNCTTVLSNSVGRLICHANDWCLMQSQFSVTQMVSRQQIGCYKKSLQCIKISLYE